MEPEAFYFGLAKLFSQFPERMPTGNQKEKDAVYSLWKDSFKHLDGKQFNDLISRFILETPKIYPGDNLIGMLFQKSQQPVLTETEGDCVELAFQAAEQFGYMREKDAMAWLKAKSPLIAATVQRVGFLEICRCEEPDVLRGQLRAIFKGEKERAFKHGGIVESAKDLQAGQPIDERLVSLTNRIGKPKLKVLPGAEKNAA